MALSVIVIIWQLFFDDCCWSMISGGVDGYGKGRKDLLFS